MSNILTNEQCAKTIGWKYRPGMPIYNGLRPWQGTDDKWHALPDFHNSLDAQEKWLWPYLREKGIFKIGFSFFDGQWQCCFGYKCDFSGYSKKSPSIAFLKAFAKMAKDANAKNI